jgi:hypothetical protein
MKKQLADSNKNVVFGPQMQLDTKTDWLTDHLS